MDQIKKIVIFGRPGAGKSTFALKLHQQTGIPVHHLDKIYFTKNWVKRDNQEYLNDLQDIIKQKAWIIEGNCLRSIEPRWQNADLVISFMYPFPTCLYRMTKRLWDKNPAVDDRAQGCKEAVRWDLITYTWRYPTRVKDLIPEMRNKYPTVPFVEIGSDKIAEKVLQDFMRKE
jgi:adenylate kinase family enzyme